MRERLQQLRERLVEFWTRMSKRQRIISVVAASVLPLGIIAAIVFLIFNATTPKMDTLYNDLSGEDASAIIEELEKENIKYELEDDGKRIMVPGEEISATRINMAGKGLPAGGTAGYELFDQTKLGVTDFVQKINNLRALQGELKRTIDGLDAVEESRIMINQPEESLFVTEQKPASASVALKLHKKKSLTPDQIRGIMNLVASSLKGMKPGNVTIIDSSGNLLSDVEKKKDEQQRIQMTELQLRQKAEIEDRYQKKITSYLNKVFGEDNVVVAVTAELDFSKTKKEDVVYKPLAEGYEAGVIRSQQSISEKYLGTGTVPEIGVPGTTSNIPGYKGLAEGNAEYQRDELTTNYEVTELRTTQEKAQGEIKHLAIGVILDEKDVRKLYRWEYKSFDTSKSEQERAKKFDEELKYVAEEGGGVEAAPEPYTRRQDVINAVKANVRAALNIQDGQVTEDLIRQNALSGGNPIPDQIDVQIIRFFEKPGKMSPADLAEKEAAHRRLMQKIWIGVIILAILVMGLLSFFALRNAVVPEEIEEEEPFEEEMVEEIIPAEELGIPELTDEQRTREKIREEVLRMIHDDPEGAALIVRSWLFDE